MAERFTGHGYALLDALARHDRHSKTTAILAARQTMVHPAEHDDLLKQGLIEEAGKVENKNGVMVMTYRLTDEGRRQLELGHPGVGRLLQGQP
jgi:hypothetical protein